VDNSELIFGGILVVVLLALAAYYGVRQIQTLRALRIADDRSLEERAYSRKQAWRRLISSVLMVILAGLLAGSVAFTPSIRRIAAANEATADDTEKSASEIAEQNLTKFVFGVYWIAVLLVFLAILALAGLDLIAIRRYGQSQLLQIQSDRRAMIDQEIARFRRDRNGHV
jgi:hypothetical protein